jgi:hypothetical protein
MNLLYSEALSRTYQQMYKEPLDNFLKPKKCYLKLGTIDSHL